MSDDDNVQYLVKGVSRLLRARLQGLRVVLHARHAKAIEAMVEVAERQLRPEERRVYRQIVRARLAGGDDVRVGDLPDLDVPLGFEMDESETLFATRRFFDR